jgi:flagellar biosynthesis component FlhA
MRAMPGLVPLRVQGWVEAGTIPTLLAMVVVFRGLEVARARVPIFGGGETPPDDDAGSVVESISAVS